jgi:hypothetical protein
MARADHARAGLTIRCAIYTRKSSDEGLEQDLAKPIEPDRKTATPTLNQRVHGSSPCAPTIEIKNLRKFAASSLDRSGIELDI